MNYLVFRKTLTKITDRLFMRFSACRRKRSSSISRICLLTWFHHCPSIRCCMACWCQSGIRVYHNTTLWWWFTPRMRRKILKSTTFILTSIFFSFGTVPDRGEIEAEKFATATKKNSYSQTNTLSNALTFHASFDHGPDASFGAGDKKNLHRRF